MPVYYLYHITNGWYTGHGYTSDITQAKTFEVPDAVSFCRRHVNHDGELGMIPVSKKMVEEVQRK